MMKSYLSGCVAAPQHVDASVLVNESSASKNDFQSDAVYKPIDFTT